MAHVNPFFHRGPIRDRSYFFGRERLLARAHAFFMEGQSVALVGPRRIGKTSLLFRLMDLSPAEEQPHPTAYIHYCYFDCESWGHASVAQIYTLLADAIRRSNGTLAAQTMPDDRHEYGAFTILETLVRQASAQGIQLVLMLDEFEALSAHSQLDSDFFAGLRALAMEHRLAYLTVSTRPLLELTYTRVTPRSSPFFNFFALFRIGLFTRAESITMLHDLSTRGGAPFTAPFIGQLIQQVGDHPFFLQMLADYAFERVVSGDTQDAALADALLRGPFRDEAVDHWGAFWRNLSAEDQRLLALFPILASSQPSGVRRLEDARLVTRADDGKPAILSHGLQTFVAEQAVAGVLQAPPVTLDQTLRVALLAGRPLALTPKQFDLLAYL